MEFWSFGVVESRDASRVPPALRDGISLRSMGGDLGPGTVRDET